jgi:predicted RNA binding protein YcfA (HicA-like mRNA interferase family)
MPINYAHLHSLTTRELISALVRDGFILDRQQVRGGSHQQYRHSDGRRVTVSFHSSGSTFTTRTLKTMIEVQARWTERDLRRLKLIA